MKTALSTNSTVPGSPFNRIKLWKNIRGFAHKCFFQHYRCSVKKGESRGELGFSALEKYRRESRFCPGFGIIWPRFSSGPWVLAFFLALFFYPLPLSLPSRSPSASFSNSFLFFERHYTSVLTFSRCRVRTSIDLCPHKWKREGVFFLFSSGSYSMERYRVPSLWYHAFVSITSNFLFYNAKERLGNRREYAFELISRRFAILYIVIVGYIPPFHMFDYQATIMNCYVSRSVFDSVFYSIFNDNR